MCAAVTNGWAVTGKMLAGAAMVVGEVAVVGESLGRRTLQDCQKRSVWVHSVPPVVPVSGSNHRVVVARLWMTVGTHRL